MTISAISIHRNSTERLSYALLHAVHGEDFPSETFHILKEKETRLYAYRTKRLALEAWEQIQHTTAELPQPLLDPPPGVNPQSTQATNCPHTHPSKEVVEYYGK